MKIFMNRSLTIFPIIFIFAISCLLNGCTISQVKGSGNISSRQFNYTDFTKLRIGGGFQANIVASDAYNIVLTADDNIFDYILMEKSGDTMYIRLKSGSYTQIHQEATISMPHLVNLNLSGGSRVNVSGFSSSEDVFAAVIANGSHLTGDLSANETIIELTDGSSIDLEGSVSSLKLISSDGSQANLDGLTVTKADFRIRDGGTAFINVTGSLNAQLSDGSRVVYSGSPVMGDIKLSGGSTLAKKN